MMYAADDGPASKCWVQYRDEDILMAEPQDGSTSLRAEL